MTQDELRKEALELFEQCTTAKAYMTAFTKEKIRAALSSPVTQVDCEWKQTVRDIYDNMHFGDKSIFNDPVSRAVVKTIEERHHDYFLTGLPPSDKGGAGA